MIHVPHFVYNGINNETIHIRLNLERVCVDSSVLHNKPAINYHVSSSSSSSSPSSPILVYTPQTPLHTCTQYSLTNLHLRLLILCKPQTNTIHTMSLISRRRITLSLKHMSQMPTAVITHNLRPLHSKRAIGISLHSTRHRVEIRRPATARFEFVRGFV